MEQKIIYCKECDHRFKSHRSKTGYACEVWGYEDFACSVPPNGWCYKAKPATHSIEIKEKTK